MQTHDLKLLLGKKEIERAVQSLASVITYDCRKMWNAREEKGELVLVGVLEGARRFCTDLAEKISRIYPVRTEFIRARSYDGMQSSGSISLEQDVSGKISGCDVLLVEDIVDTGRTLAYLKKCLEEKEPRTLKSCAFLNKPGGRLPEFKDLWPDYAGYSFAPKQTPFVVGYGIDFNGCYRELDGIYELVARDSSKTENQPGSGRVRRFLGL